MQQGLLKRLASESSFTPIDAEPQDDHAGDTHDSRRPAVCFAPGTSPKIIAKVQSEVYEADLYNRYRVNNRWTSTATNGSISTRGTPITLTWSVVSDGTMVPARTSNGNDGAVSNLKSFLNGIYGNEATWLALFQQVFDRWSQISGVTYVYQATDDGAALPGYTGSNFSNGASGALSTRGDVRICGRLIDGPSNILAYNYFPNSGDMVLDTGDTSFNTTTTNSIRLRNTMWHEHGHGLGFNHVCPTNGTKLMEPFLNINFAGPQLDDALSVQRDYGDALEKTGAGNNDTVANATSLGTLANGTLTRGSFTPNDGSIATPTGTPGFGNDDPVSIDGTNDTDMYSFSVGAGRKYLVALLHPTGTTYLEAAQNGDGTCPAGSSFSSHDLSDLTLQLLTTDGVTPLSTANFTTAGQDEQITYLLPNSSGPFYLKVTGATDNVQMYELSLTLSDAPNTPFFQSGGTTVVSDSSGNGNNNGRPDPGESAVGLTIPVANLGVAGATGVSATLTSLTATVNVVSGTVAYPDIASNATASNAAPFVIAVDPSHPCGSPIQLQVTVTSAQASNAFSQPNLSTGASVSTTIPYTGSAVPIPDSTGQNVAGTPAIATITVAGAGTIDDLNFAFDGTNSANMHGLTHSYVGDLFITLTSPEGTVVTLIDRMGSGGTQGPNFVGTILDDEAASSIQSATTGPFTGSFTPASALSAFDGENPNGTWTLRVRDDYIGDTGTIRAFSLRLTSTVCNSPSAGPTITSFTPTSGNAGTAVTITGTNFTGATNVSFNGTSAVFTVNNATQISTNVPAGATTGPITVTTPINTATSASNFTVSLITPIAGDDSFTVDEDSGATALGVLANDSSNGGGALSITSKTNGLNGTVTITGGGTGLTYAPNADYNGSDSFTYTISNGSGTATATVNMTITPVSETPTISNILDLQIQQDTSSGGIDFSISDGDTPASLLGVSGTSSNTTLVPNANIAFGGNSGSRQVIVTPAAGQTGTTTIAVTVTDGVLSASDSFVLTVAPGFSISGRIQTSNGTPISGVSITRTGSATAVLTDASGNYTFTSVPGSTTYTLTPSKSGYAFTPVTRSVPVTNANVANQNFTGSNYTINGRVAFSNGTGIPNVEVRLNTGRNVLTNGAGFYTFTAIFNGAYTVTPVLAGFSFDPNIKQVTVTNANVSNVNFTGGYAINGRISDNGGIGLVGLRVYRTGSAVAALTNSAGYFAFYGVTNGTYTLTPDTTQGFGYTPATRSVMVSGATVNNQNFIGTSGFSISGRVATSGGSGISGVTMTRTGSATPVTTNGAGYYTFFGVVNGTYTITPSKSGNTFTPVTRNVTVAGANISNQNFTGSGP